MGRPLTLAACAIAAGFLPVVAAELTRAGVELRGDELACELASPVGIERASDAVDRFDSVVQIVDLAAAVELLSGSAQLPIVEELPGCPGAIAPGRPGLRR